jgi:hypothetical protein
MRSSLPRTVQIDVQIDATGKAPEVIPTVPSDELLKTGDDGLSIGPGLRGPSRFLKKRLWNVECGSNI